MEKNKTWVRLPLLGVLIALILNTLSTPAGAQTSGPPSRPGGTPTDHDGPAGDHESLLERYGPLRFVVDPSLVPRTPTIEPVDGTRDSRQVGAMSFPDGTTAELVIDHVVLVTKSDAEGDAFLGRWSGTVLESDRADSEGQMHMVKVDPSAADVAALPASLLAIEPEQVGEHKVGDPRVLKLLALVAQEAAAGTTVTVSWMAESDGIGDGQVFEGAEVPEPKNVFDWPYMNIGSPQDIGVARAWQLLQAEGKLGANVRVLVNDGGFIPNADSAKKWTIDYMEFNESNPMTCTKGAKCPWHGTYVIAAAMAEVDNDFGVAGPAGPLASDVIAVGNGGDAWTRFRRTARETEEHHARIVNMSWSHTAHFFKDAQANSTDRHLRHMNEAGALVFAAAGNHDRDVDDDALILPCESSRVMCVGGMGWNSTLLADKSNYGTNDDSTSVDIYGPMCTWAINDPSIATDTGIKQVCGTSIASPFVAGVAALVMAADPTLDYKQVEAILLQTAHFGGLGGEWWSGSQLRVNAARAVATALHAGPTVDITAPVDKSEHSILESYGFTADVADYHGDPLPLQWSSSISGQLGAPKPGVLAWPNLPFGKHVITAKATDDFGDSTTDQITIEVVDEKALVDIVTPAKNASYPAGFAITLTGKTWDPDTSDPVPDNQAKWVIRRTGTKVPVLEAGGHQASLPAAKALAGNYVAEFTADGSTDSHPFKVVAPAPGHAPPTVTITSPAQAVTLLADGLHAKLHVAGTATDKEDGAVPGTRFRWTATSKSGTKVLCTGSAVPGNANTIKDKQGKVQDCSSVDVQLAVEDGTGTTIWSLTLEVFDSTNERGIDDVTVTVLHLVG